MSKKRAVVVSGTALKGGVGKTSVNAALVEGLADRGRRVLAVDGEGQKSWTTLYGVDPEPGYTMYEVLAGQGRRGNKAVSIRDIAVPLGPRLDLAPASRSLYHLDFDELGAQALGRALEPVLGDYDVIAVDPPPGDNAVFRMVMYRADAVMALTQAEPMGLQALAGFWATIKEIQAAGNPGLQLMGIAVNMYHCRRMVDRECMAALLAHRELGPRVLDFTLRDGAGVPKAALYGKTGRSVVRYPRYLAGPVREDFEQLVDYVDECVSMLQNVNVIRGRN